MGTVKQGHTFHCFFFLECIVIFHENILFMIDNMQGLLLLRIYE